MVWTQKFESDDVGRLEEIQNLVRSFETTGEIESVSIEISADAPITVQSPTDTQAVTTSSSPDTGRDDGHSDTTQTTKYSIQSESTADQTTAAVTHDTQQPSVEPQESADPEGGVLKVRKWPRMGETLGSESDVPLPATAYPGETVEFDGQSNDDVEHGTPYHVRVNGTKEYGAFVTLNGSGYSPNSQYTDVTGLLHHSEMQRRGPSDYTQGDSIVVELVEHSEKGLSFRELPLLSTDDAKQARHAELLRFNKLGVEEGDEVRFSEWPDSREHTGTIESINNGTDTPPTPPRLEVQTGGETYSVLPSELIASAADGLDQQVGGEEVNADQSEPTRMSAAPDELVLSTETPTDAPASGETDATPDSPATGDEETHVGESEAASTEGEDEVFECVCGDTFDSTNARGGHQRWCDDYQETLATDSEPDASTTGNGRVLNPIVLDVQYAYAKTAVALYLADEDELPVAGIFERLEGTEWEMDKANINAHFNQLLTKEAVRRRRDDVYVYTLTDRGTAGVEQLLSEVDDREIPAL